MHMENCDELALCVEEPIANIRETYTCNKQVAISADAREMSCSHSFAWHCVQTLANHALSLIHQNLGTLVSEPRNPAPKQINSRTSRAPCPASFRVAYPPGCEIVVATFRTMPITGLELHGLAMRVVAIRAPSIIVIPTHEAEPIAGQPLLQQWPGTPAIPTGAIHE